MECGCIINLYFINTKCPKEKPLSWWVLITRSPLLDQSNFRSIEIRQSNSEFNIYYCTLKNPLIINLYFVTPKRQNNNVCHSEYRTPGRFRWIYLISGQSSPSIKCRKISIYLCISWPQKAKKKSVSWWVSTTGSFLVDRLNFRPIEIVNQIQKKLTCTNTYTKCP